MKLKNNQIEVLYLLTKDLKLNARDSRYRNRFNKILIERLQKIFIPERIEIINEFALKDENGKLVNENGNYIIPHENMKEFTSEIENIDNEQFTIEDNEDNKEMLLSIYKTLTSDTIEIDGEYADVHDDVCIELEKTIKFYEEIK